MLRFILYLNGDRSVSRALLPIPFFVMCDSVAFLVSKSRAQGCDSFDPLPTLATSNIIMGCPTEPCCNHMAFHTKGRTTLPWNPKCPQSLSRNLQCVAYLPDFATILIFSFQELLRRLQGQRCQGTGMFGAQLPKQNRNRSRCVFSKRWATNRDPIYENTRHLSICLSVCLSVCLSIYLSIYLSINQSINHISAWHSRWLDHLILGWK